MPCVLCSVFSTLDFLVCQNLPECTTRQHLVLTVRMAPQVQRYRQELSVASTTQLSSVSTQMAAASACHYIADVYLLQDHMSDNLSGSTPQSAVAAATAAAAAVSSSSNSTGTPRHADGRHSSDSTRAAALMQTAEPAGPASAGAFISLAFLAHF